MMSTILVARNAQLLFLHAPFAWLWPALMGLDPSPSSWRTIMVFWIILSVCHLAFQVTTRLCGSFRTLIHNRWPISVGNGLKLNSEFLQTDGKTICGSKENGEKTVHIVSVYAHNFAATLFEKQICQEENEILVFEQILLSKKILFQVKTVTWDTMFCQRSFCILKHEIKYAGNLESPIWQSLNRRDVRNLFLAQV